MWGSCSANSDIKLNWRLIHFDLKKIDYVVVHELSHLIELNHSKKFWDIVEGILPDYQLTKKNLRDYNLRKLPEL
mgnify:CR=1 FL=1|tara:strand:+ start:162 stop:386 length:225 start_codon:yes stop_codon:yes gene_type:complete